MKRYSWLLLTPFFFSCDNLTKSKDSSTTVKKEKQLNDQKDDENGTAETPRKNKAVKYDELETNSDADILNNIIVHESGGLIVSKAYLTFEDGTLVPKSNRSALSKPVYLNLAIEDGWEVKNGEVSLDASEKITTHDGEVVLNATSLFKEMPIIKANKASNIYLKANITGTRPDIDYFIVNYRVWDKWGEGEVKGRYKLYIDAR